MESNVQVVRRMNGGDDPVTTIPFPDGAKVTIEKDDAGNPVVVIDLTGVEAMVDPLVPIHGPQAPSQALANAAMPGVRHFDHLASKVDPQRKAAAKKAGKVSGKQAEASKEAQEAKPETDVAQKSSRKSGSRKSSAKRATAKKVTAKSTAGASK